MVTDEKIDRIYEAVIASDELSTKKLESFDITTNDIRTLCKQEIIERVKRGQYQIKNIDGLFYYGKKLIAKKQYSKADLCFKKCFELNPNHLGACFQLFIRSVRSKNYEEALMFLDKLFTSDNRYYLQDANYYLYLLSMLTNLSEKHQTCVMHMTIQDILVSEDDKRFEDVQMENQIRIAAYQKKLAYAIRLLKELANNQSKKVVQTIIEKELLQQILEKIQKMYKDLFSLIKDKKYLAAIDLLEQKKSELGLSIIEYSILELLQDYIHIEKTGLVPFNEIKICNNVFEAISAKDYFYAYELNSAYNVQKGIEDKLSILSILLEDICTLIKQINEKNKVKTSETSLKEDETNAFDFTVSGTQDQAKIMALIITLLLDKDVTNALNLLKKYLQLIGKSEYEFLISDLIQLSILEKDMTFTKPMLTLTMLNSNNFLDITEYINAFYNSLSQRKFKQANIYLDIISKTNKLGQYNISISALTLALDSLQKAVNKKDNEALAIFQTNQAPEAIEKEEISEPLKLDKPAEQAKIKPKELKLSDDETQKFRDIITEKYTEIKDGSGLVLLKDEKDIKVSAVKDIAKEFNIKVFKITYNGKKYIVLKYRPFIKEQVDINAARKQASEAYKAGDYDKCIECSLLVSYFYPHIIYMYSLIGLAYLKKGNIKAAINYLTVATALSNQDGVNYDFSELITRLQRKKLLNTYDEDNQKRFVKMSLADFNISENDFFGISNFEEIHTYVMNSGLDIESACQNLDMSDDEIAIVKLVYARELYRQEFYSKGDEFVKDVEKKKSKDAKTIRLLTEVKTNRNFYNNRKTSMSLNLTSNLQITRKRKLNKS